MALFFTLPNGSKLRLPRTGEAVQVKYVSKPEWGWLPAIVDESTDPAGERAEINVVVFNRRVWPGKVGFHQGVGFGQFGEAKGVLSWRHVPE